MSRSEITDQQWDRIAHLLPGQEGYVGPEVKDNRLFINAVLWVARSGIPWLDLPERFGPWSAVYQRFRRWAKSGVWRNVFEALQEPELVDNRFYHRACPLACRWSKKGGPTSEFLAGAPK